MKTIIKIITYINRLFEGVFLLLIFSGILISDILFYTLWFAFFLGIFQVIASLISLFKYLKLRNKTQRRLQYYFIMVTTYFVSWYIISEFNLINDFDYLIYIMWGIPVFLSLYITMTFEKINSEL